ncbi:putative RNase H-like nuclease [Deinococcus metalli]|uniref:Putative RNase H-like nuclease n=1 Tax=Deinococcus metalli TaxID=1141878 RepID=A0A7W8KGG3_9DEIO|nr:putative RNase H-like nuclease [Deinococcus metalli]
MRNPSGGAVVRLDGAAGDLTASALLGDDADVMAFLDRHVGASGGCLVAVDAPLAVPNAAGRRPAEAALGTVFARFHAGAHPTNRARVADAAGSVRGERVVAALAERGFVHDPWLHARAEVRRVVEVYPHPAMVSLFGLSRTLKYKNKGQGRALLDAAWAELYGHLRALETAEPALRGLDALLATDPTTLRGRALKDHEDRVDAVVCAYIALYAWWWGAARTEVFGTLEGGSILTPTLPERWPGARTAAS